MLLRIQLLVATAVLAAGLPGCGGKSGDSASNEAKIGTGHADASISSEVAKLSNQLKHVNRCLYDSAISKNTIRDYEIFLNAERVLESEQSNKDQQEDAIDRIYGITRKADLVPLYRRFISRYADSPQAAKARTRLCEIAYAVALEGESIASYSGFVSKFPIAPEELLQDAWRRLLALEEEAVLESLNQMKPADDVPATWADIYAEWAIEKTGRRLYREAVDAQEAKNEITFVCKYRTIMESDVFADSNVRFHLTRDREMRTHFEGISRQIENLRKDVAQLNSVVDDAFGRIEKKLDVNEEYLQDIVVMIEQQKEFLEGHPDWGEVSVALGVVNLGLEAIPYVRPARVLLKRGFAKLGNAYRKSQ